MQADPEIIQEKLPERDPEKFSKIEIMQADPEIIQEKLPERDPEIPKLKDPRISVFSTGEQSTARFHRNHLESVVDYCIRNGYNYHLILPERENVLDTFFNYVNWTDRSTGMRERFMKGYKPFVAWHLFDKLDFEYLMYLDIDVSIVKQDVNMIYIIEKAKKLSKRNPDCHFIAQENGCNMNAGWFILKSGSEGRKFLLSWIENLIKYWSIWQSDQGSLMNLILHYAAKASNESYSNECAEDDLMGEPRRNSCWNHHLNNWNYEHNYRQFGGICLLGSTPTQRVQMHDCGQLYEAGDMMYHSHAPPPLCHILEISGPKVPNIIQKSYRLERFWPHWQWKSEDNMFTLTYNDQVRTWEIISEEEGALSLIYRNKDYFAQRLPLHGQALVEIRGTEPFRTNFAIACVNRELTSLVK